MYILVGDDPDEVGHKIIYVGEGLVAERLKKHNMDEQKAFWDDKTVVVVGRVEDDLNDSECRYLESCLINLASKSGVAQMKNGQKPALPTMSKPQITKAENFLTQIQTLLPVLNIDYFIQTPNVLPAQDTGAVAVSASTRFEYITATMKAKAEEVDNKFVVLEGSWASSIEAPSIGKSNIALRAQLRTNGVLVDDVSSDKWVFAENFAFNSPSAAAAVIGGTSISGPQTWKVEGTAQTYKQWLQAKVDAVPE